MTRLWCFKRSLFKYFISFIKLSSFFSFFRFRTKCKKFCPKWFGLPIKVLKNYRKRNKFRRIEGSLAKVLSINSFHSNDISNQHVFFVIYLINPWTINHHLIQQFIFWKNKQEKGLLMFLYLHATLLSSIKC